MIEIHRSTALADARAPKAESRPTIVRTGDGGGGLPLGVVIAVGTVIVAAGFFVWTIFSKKG